MRHKTRPLKRFAQVTIASCLSMTALLSEHARASGVSPYLPLNVSPEIERAIERVLILADKPVMTRPIAAATVVDALPAACEVDETLCRRVRRYLDRYTHAVGISDASVAVASSTGSAITLPNEHALPSDSEWEVSAQAYWQPIPYTLVNMGGIAYDDGATPTGSIVSVGFEYAQLDIGYRDHWLSPFTQSAMLISSNAETMPSVTLSSYSPITPLGFRYEVFAAEMSYTDQIRYGNGLTEGNPRLAGIHLSMEPSPGWSLAANRIMQYGGGERGQSSFKDLLNAFYDPGGFDARTSQTLDTEFGNQAAAVSSRFIFPGPVPFAAYLEYAGEDRAYEGNYRFGNAALSIGITFPRLWQAFDFTYEVSEWQNSWYVHGIYREGLTNERHALGHWGADQRIYRNPVGSQAHMLRVGWEPPSGGLLQVRARTLSNEEFLNNGRSRTAYDRMYDLTLAYSRSAAEYTVGAELIAGRDVFGDSFGRLEGYFRFAGEWSDLGRDGGYTARTRPDGAELFVETGLSGNRVRITEDYVPVVPRYTTDDEITPHVAIGARRPASRNGDLGVRLELDRVNDEYLLAVRAIDYRYRFTRAFAASAFLGAARYDTGSPAFGYYGGLGVQWRDFLPRMDLNLDARYADKVARDKLLPSDPATIVRNDIFYDISSVSLYLSYRW